MNDRDFRQGVPLGELPSTGPLFGKAGDDAVMLVRDADGIRAFSATCTHYSGPLADGLVTGETVHCPWHHACFSLRTGEAIAAPALNPLARYHVTERDGSVYVGEKMEDVDPLDALGRAQRGPASVVIIGAGAAGSAAAEMLRREGYDGPVTLIDPDADAPYDRPNLSKDYLAGHASEEWLPLRPADFYESHGITRRVASVSAIDAAKQTVQLDNGDTLSYGALLIATGAAPIKPPIPGADQSHVHVLRSLADCHAILRSIEHAKDVLVAGASFIGMEVAASLRQRGVAVTVAAPEAVPFARVLGNDLGAHLRDVHEKNDVRFRLGRSVKAIKEKSVVLDDDSEVACDVVVLGIGVRPLISLAEKAGIKCDGGVLVNEFLQTSVPTIYAAGDIAKHPDPRGGAPYRVEHWVVAQRQGQNAARNILGMREPYRCAPFFWTQQFDVQVAYVGHATEWDAIDGDGEIGSNDCRLTYNKDGKAMAVVTIGRDLESLRAEVSMESAR